ncbi:MAG: hypothetical protein DRH08_00940 [Deltaproteobacteria bacterium]|nr:MAG: hypothetical protein DRH08_00940 [Deltaproteobacteria bacterium]
MSADLILKNLHAVTFAEQSEPVELIAVKGNKITYAGTADALGQLKGPETREMDCCGGLVVPGFNDAHCHVFASAVTRLYADCSKVCTIADLQVVLRKKARDIKRGQWLRAANCDFSKIVEGRFPNSQDLDAAVADLPVLLLERSGQHCVLNSMALKLCGVTKDTSSPGSGSKLSEGVISGNNELVASSIPPLTEQEVEAGLRQANKEYLSLGITSLQDTSWSNSYQHWLTMKSFKDRGELAPRLTLLPGVDSLEEFEAQGLKTGYGDEYMRLGAVKIALDESTGNPCPPQDELNDIALKAYLAGFQLAFHVADVSLLQASLRALDFIREHAPSACVRPRFEHCPVCPPALLPNLVKCGAIVVSQPNLFYETGPRYLEQFSSENLASVYPLKSLLNRGIPLAFSSDSPLTSANPFSAILASVSRKVSGGALLSPHEKISFVEALKAYTHGGAYASCEEQTKGSIAVGMLADMVVLNRDPLTMSQEAITGTKSIATLIDGKVVWEC